MAIKRTTAYRQTPNQGKGGTMPRRNSNTDIPITFRVGAPPATPPRPRHRPVASVWQTAILGMLIVTAVMTIALGQHAASGIPASTTTSTSTAP